MEGVGEWEPDAENWVRWARTPKHDAYWYYRDSFFEVIVPPPGRGSLEVGCGEGRVARDLMARGHRVTALDTSHTLLRYAREADTTSSYVLADGSAVPFPDRHFDLAIAYNALQVVGDMARTIMEMARVLDRGGRLCLCIAHPVTDLGHFDSHEPEASFTVRRGYFERSRVEDTVRTNGLTMTFRGWTYSLEEYSVALEEAGVRIELIREPRPTGPPGPFDKWLQVPLFMFVRAIKP